MTRTIGSGITEQGKNQKVEGHEPLFKGTVSIDAFDKFDDECRSLKIDWRS
ncbi:hypothetical protein [Moorena sp. SIO4G3]|uniref:hypothetical protein n=1 Tax=Moorena sp. SIO4G3 TaxID=2607821 RepID=UPI00142ABFC6|nr:hypothetical protein [Moorena sp. SIO4G3]NEO79432.1 hypothetical protein [Moorena sp. SIO4G3]